MPPTPPLPPPPTPAQELAVRTAQATLALLHALANAPTTASTLLLAQPRLDDEGCLCYHLPRPHDWVPGLLDGPLLEAGFVVASDAGTQVVLRWERPVLPRVPTDDYWSPAQLAELLGVADVLYQRVARYQTLTLTATGQAPVLRFTWDGKVWVAAARPGHAGVRELAEAALALDRACAYRVVLDEDDGTLTIVPQLTTRPA